MYYLPNQLSQFQSMENKKSLYSPSEVVKGFVNTLSSNNLEYKFLVLSGPSGIGKSSFVKFLCGLNRSEVNWVLIPRVTTREKRKNENSSELKFLDNKQFEFLEHNNKLIYSETYRDSSQKYGILTENISNLSYTTMPNTVFLLFGTVSLLQILPHSAYIYFVPPSIKELRKRVIKSERPNIEEVMSYNTREISALYRYLEISEAQKLPISVICMGSENNQKCLGKLQRIVKHGQTFFEKPQKLYVEISSNCEFEHAPNKACT